MKTAKEQSGERALPPMDTTIPLLLSAFNALTIVNVAKRLIAFSSGFQPAENIEHSFRPLRLTTWSIWENRG
jgi:hypothetical protein